jgi:putative hydrolase of the HAD superfamily|tara:strand:+ start:645 stop:1316 length:672 start_codon:yes stop_codon:yes gene_type:complete
MKNFKKIEYFIFDLDGVCYLQLSEVFGRVSKRMGEYISKKLNVSLTKAKEIQTAYFHEYNTTLNGLMLKHKIDPHEFLKYVHDIDISFLEKDKILREELIKLKAKKYIFTNGSHDHVLNVTKHLGINDLFDGTFDITDSNFLPKPLIEPYEMLIKKFNINPKKAIFIDDIAKNLEPAKKIGMKTAWLINNEYWGKKDSDQNYIDLKIENLSSFLKEINILKTA